LCYVIYGSEINQNTKKKKKKYKLTNIFKIKAILGLPLFLKKFNTK
jgi:hypothetical protein